MDNNQKRDRWPTRTAFILAAVGSAVGLGNIWRFPHVAFNSGGGAFFIPYFIALFTAGIPLLMLEYGLGHRMQGSAPASMGRVKKKFEFVGWWAALGGLMITFYYTIILAWVCFYFWELTETLFSGATVLPWDRGSSNAETYMLNNVITGDAAHSQGENDFSRINWWAIGFNGLIWTGIYFTIRKGAESIGKIVLPTVTVPFILLFVLFFTAINLDGSSAGLSYYLTPDWSKVDDIDEMIAVAQAAYGQIFFSLSIGFGIMMAYASFLPKKADISNNAFITAFANSGTEFFAGFITFSVLGFLALQKGVFVNDVVGSSSFTLALISYPTTISNIPVGLTGQILIGLAFFGSLMLLGFTSAFSLVEAMVAGITDKFGITRKAIARIFCLAGWTVGIAFCTPGGLTLLDVIDHYLSGYGLLIVGLGQCIVVGWILGPKNLRNHLNRVSERRITHFWDFCIKYFTPVVLTFLLGYTLFDDLKFLWDTENAKPYSGYSTVTQLIGVGSVVVALAIALWLAARKSEKTDFNSMPEFDYED